MFIKPNRHVDRVFIHCSASDHDHHDSVEVMREWHTSPPNNWRDVGYHYFITKSGEIQEGRDLEISPAAQRGHNTGTIAICLHGLKEENFTEAQFQSLQNLAVEIDNAYLGDVSFHGHCEVSNKTCPVFDYVSVLDLDDRGYLGDFW